MLKTVGLTKHFIVGVFVVGMGALGAVGVIGAGDQALTRPEHFDAKYVEVTSAGEAHPDGVRIRETVDIDFGLAERRGYERIIPHDFGIPVDVTASSPDANDSLDVVERSSSSRIRIGDRNVTFTGQHRYFLEYTLPEAQLGSRRLSLDIIGHGETFVTDRFTVVVDGFEFTETTCDLGERGTFGGCELSERSDGSFAFVVEPLEPGEGITVGGGFTGRETLSESTIPAVPPRNPSGFRPFGLALVVIGGLAAAASYFRLRSKGSNEVFGAGGASDAAFGDLGLPAAGDPVADVPTYRVPDNRLAEMATIEFVPPRGLEPWHGRVLLSEYLDSGAVSAWFAEMIAREAIVIEKEDGTTTLVRGQSVARLNSVDQALLTALFKRGPKVELGRYDSSFAELWASVAAHQQRVIDDSGWWSPALNAPPSWKPFLLGLGGVVMVVGLIVINLGSEIARGVLGGVFGRQPGAILLTLLVVFFVANLLYGGLRPSRTATGSALTLRTESFRRFLVASEGKHVDWAWDQGVIREYSALAVALDAADAWSEAIEASNVTDKAVSVTGPLAVHTMTRSFTSSVSKPSSSSSGGGGGFSGGSGGGGGGGSSGSW